MASTVSLLDQGTRAKRRTCRPTTAMQLLPLSVPLGDLRPTQTAVGMRAVAAKRRRLKDKGDKLESFLKSRAIPAVRGPRNTLYIVDHHHRTLALLQCGVETVFVNVVGDLADLPRDDFWRAMIANGWAYPFNEEGEPIAHRHIPASIAQLRADPYRDLAWSVRENGGFEKSWLNYSEFRWANYFRTSIDPRVVEDDYERAVALALRLAKSSSAAHLPGYIGKSEARALRAA